MRDIFLLPARMPDNISTLSMLKPAASPARISQWISLFHNLIGMPSTSSQGMPSTCTKKTLHVLNDTINGKEEHFVSMEAA
jgi:hypothetical protein